MSERDPADQPLRDLLRGAEHLTRELLEHVDKALGNKNQQLREILSRNDSAAISDITVRNQVALVLTSDQFAQELCQKLEVHLAAVDRRAQQALDGAR